MGGGGGGGGKHDLIPGLPPVRRTPYHKATGKTSGHPRLMEHLIEDTEKLNGYQDSSRLKLLFVGCLTSQHESVSQGQIRSDSCRC